MNLSQMQLGQRATVEEVLNSKSSLRLMELGFIPGSEVYLQSIAPTGDPIAVLVDHSLISLRKKDAVAIVVKLVNQEAI